MKIALIHFSDFHVKASDSFSDTKIKSMLDSLNVLGKVDEFVIVFTGDLAHSGEINEYKASRALFGKIIDGIKRNKNVEYINLVMIPGNHDLCLPQNPRDRKEIQSHYDDETIDDFLEIELTYLDNFYNISNAKGKTNFRLINNCTCSFDGYTIQFNQINTAPFSTLEPDDKELHYFPQEKLRFLNKKDNVNLCITLMHHNCESFNWMYKSDLETAIVNSSEMLFIGHDHREQFSTISVENSLNTWISAAGEMRFSSIEKADSFNVIVVDTCNILFDGYSFSWNVKSKIYNHKHTVISQKIIQHTGRLSPVCEFTKSIKEDGYNRSKDFTKYFVFPKLVTEAKNEFGKIDEIKTVEELFDVIKDKKRIVITGANSSGKTTLLKYVYCESVLQYTPIILSVDASMKIKSSNCLKHLFEDQYGDDRDLYERFLQLPKTEKIIIVDGWDLIQNIHERKKLFDQLEENFEYIILGINDKHEDLVETIKGDVQKEISFCELHIKPFFTEKRNQLVRKICNNKDMFTDEDIDNVTRLIDHVIQNNSGMFLLNPGFIICYTNYFLDAPIPDYARGECVFSEVFEFELKRAIIEFSDKNMVDETLTVFEEIAGYMYTQQKEKLTTETINTIVETYKTDYGVDISSKKVLETAYEAKVFKQCDDCSVYFYNKNHLAYFIAKYLIRKFKEEPSNKEGIMYALKHICFGINSDIILFMLYIQNDIQTIMSILNEAGLLLEPWSEISIDNKNIAVLTSSSGIDIKPPTDDEKREYERVQEKAEELSYTEEIIDAKDVFSYDESKFDSPENKLIRAIKYTELLCKSLPAFNSTMKLSQKTQLVSAAYSFPRKIAYAVLRPIDLDFKSICDSLYEFVQTNNITTKKGQQYTPELIKELVIDYSRAYMLSTFDHFSELCTSPKTISILTEKNIGDTSEALIRLLTIENSGNTEMLIKEAEAILKNVKELDVEIMIKLIIRKHLLLHPSLPFNKKQSIIDKFFGKEARSQFLISQ